MFLFNAFILYLKTENQKLTLVCRKPYYSTTCICKRPLPPSTEFGLGFKLLQKDEVHCTVINLSVTCLSLVVLSVSQAYSLRHDISKRLSLKINTVKIQKSILYAVKSLVEDVCVFCFVFYGVFFFVFCCCFCYCCANTN